MPLVEEWMSEEGGGGGTPVMSLVQLVYSFDYSSLNRPFQFDQNRIIVLEKHDGYKICKTAGWFKKLFELAV